MNPDTERHLDVEADFWSYTYARWLGLVLLFGFVTPLLKSNYLAGATTLLWPWDFWSTDHVPWVTPAEPEGLWATWSLTPLVAGLAVLLLRRCARGPWRSIGLGAVGLTVLALNQFVFTNEGAVYGLIFMAPDPAYQGFLLALTLSAGAIAIANHLRKSFPVRMAPRILSAAGGLLIFALLCVRLPGIDQRLAGLLFRGGAWSSEGPVNVVLLLLLGYAALGLASGLSRVVSLHRVQVLSLYPRVALVFLPFLYLILRDGQPDGFVTHMIEGSTGTTGAVLSLLKFCSIFYGGTLLLNVGLTGLAQWMLWKRPQPAGELASPARKGPSRLAWATPTVLALVLVLGYLDARRQVSAAAGTGPSPAARSAATLEPRWQFQIGSPVTSTPAVHVGRVFVGGIEPGLYALDAATGSVAWNFPTSGGLASPAAVGGVVYFGSSDGHVYSVAAATGSERWRFSARMPIESAVAVSGELVCAATYSGWNGKVFGLEARSGEKRWVAELEGAVVGGPVISGEVVYFTESVPGTSGYVHAVDAHEGRSLWRYTANARVGASPCVAGDTAYVPCDDGTVTAISLATREPRWEFKASKRVRSTPTVAEERLYFGSDDERLYAVDTSTGREIWKLELGSWVRARPVVEGGRIYALDGDGDVYVVDAESQRVLGRFNGNASADHAPAVSGGVIYVGGWSTVAAVESP